MSDRKSLLREIETPAQLLVEGRTPEIFFREMVEHLDLKDRIQVRDFGSIGDLTDYLKTFTQLADFIEKVNSLGIIRDAEDKPAIHGFTSVCASLKIARIEPPDKIGEVVRKTIGAKGDDAESDHHPDKVGEVARKTINVGVFILPDCQNEGMLETVCLEAVANEVEVLKCMDDYFNCLHSKKVNLPKNITKAKTWTFLATKNLSDPQVGRAAQKKIWPWDSTALEKLRMFLNSI
jgi:hypothetical protein